VSRSQLSMYQRHVCLSVDLLPRPSHRPLPSVTPHFLLIIIITSGQCTLTYQYQYLNLFSAPDFIVRHNRRRIATADGRFNRVRQAAPTCPLMWSHWRHVANSIILVLSSAHAQVYNKNGKSMGLSVYAQLTSESSCTLQWAPLSPKIAPSHG